MLAHLPFPLLEADRAVALVPSATAHAALAARGPWPGTTILGVGDPVYTAPGEAGIRSPIEGYDLSPLPGSLEEIKAVTGENDVRLHGGDATEARVLATLASRSSWRAVHFACHGILDERRPEWSSLALTPAAGDDGLFSVLEIVGLAVPTELAVLSACETGRGASVSGEGLLSLSSAFLHAGARRVIASLWKVDDEATRALMSKFYELWDPTAGSGLSAAAALREAQAFVRGHEKWAHPYYWAAWVLWGRAD